ncbi:MAG: Gfo/Idh/MocA family oxidoreductase [Bacteroidales bacterium]|nr:Gfo/Idh/MocA family oxidoreductase [Bacteroidales bacterium]
MNEKTKQNLSRRNFIRNTTAVTAGLTILPSHVIGGLGHRSPGDKLNIVGVGVGGRGGGVIKQLRSENIVALCDVDWKYSAGIFSEFPDAKKYYDWRVMFEELKDSFDAVVVGTPDHTHAIIALTAMQMGKHVYCEKPLTHSVWESRQMTEYAKKYKVVTQMGNQGNSGEGIRQICEWIWNGEIGDVTEVHCWTNRPIWPQGLERPDTVEMPHDKLKWDLFLGPAKERPFNNVYHPWNWRGWWDFGTGALGDMACHVIDPVFKALRLQYPTKVQGSSTMFNTESAPMAEMVQYVFPKRDPFMKTNMPEVKITWWDGGLLPPRPEELAPGEMMGRDGNGGTLFIGTKGKLMSGCYAANPFILGREAQPAPKMLRRIDAGHYMDWVNACKAGYDNALSKDIMPSSNFDYSGPLNEMVVMGVIAVRLQDLKRELLWDGKNMKFTNISDSEEIQVVKSDKFSIIDGHPHFDTKHETINAKAAAEEYIKHTYRQGWSI